MRTDMQRQPVERELISAAKFRKVNERQPKFYSRLLSHRTYVTNSEAVALIYTPGWSVKIN